MINVPFPPQRALFRGRERARRGERVCVDLMEGDTFVKTLAGGPPSRSARFKTANLNVSVGPFYW